MKTTVTSLILFTLFSLNAFAQDYTQFSLPEGAKARLGKGKINDIQYSPDGTQLVVAGSIGIWLYDTATHQVENSRNGEVALLTGHTSSSIVSRSVPMGVRLQVGVPTIRCGCGMLKRAAQRHSHGHTSSVNSVAFSPDGGTIASGSSDDTVRLLGC